MYNVAIRTRAGTETPLAQAKADLGARAAKVGMAGVYAERGKCRFPPDYLSGGSEKNFLGEQWISNQAKPNWINAL